MDTVLRIENLTKTFPRKVFHPLSRRKDAVITALDDINLSIKKPGEVVSVSGPNGSGKTTLLKCIAGIVTPTRGKIKITGFDLHAHSHELKHLVGMSTDQERSFYWRLTGRDNIRFFAGLFGLGRKKIDERIRELSEILDVTSWLDLPFSQYSTGIRQRFSVLRAVVHQPEILLLDEPHRSLDKAARQTLWRLVKKLSLVKGMTTIYTTHETATPEMEDATRVFLHKGKIVP